MSNSDLPAATAIPTSPPAPQVIILSLLDLARVLQEHPQNQPRFDAECLPYLLGQIHQGLPRHLEELERLNSVLAWFTSTDKSVLTGDDIAEKIRRLEMSILLTDAGFQGWKTCFMEIAAITEVLEGSGWLSDGNAANFEDIQRLMRDFEEEILRTKEELEGFKLA